MQKNLLILARVPEYGDPFITIQENTSSTSAAWWEQQGYILLGERMIEIDLPPREFLVSRQVAALKAQQAAKRAEAEAACTDIQRTINGLLQLTVVDADEKLPVRQAQAKHNNGDITDIPF